MPFLQQVEAETAEADADMTGQEAPDALSIDGVANQAEHKQQAYESNKRLKKSLQAVSSDKGAVRSTCTMALPDCAAACVRHSTP